MGRLFSSFLVSWNNTCIVAPEVWTCGRVVSFYHLMSLWLLVSGPLLRPLQPLPVIFFPVILSIYEKLQWESSDFRYHFRDFGVFTSFLTRNAILRKLLTWLSGFFFFFFFFFCKIEVPLRLTLKILSGLFYFDSGCQCGGSLLALSPGLLTAPYVPAVE